MTSALPIPVTALGGESHVLPFIYFVFILYLFVFIGQPESSLCLPDAEATSNWGAIKGGLPLGRSGNLRSAM